jgi:hypothetical protein
VVTETHTRASSLRVSGRARRTGIGVTAAVAAAVLLAGCATGRDAQTANQKPAIDGISATSGTLGIRGAAIQAPASGAFYTAGQSAPLTLTLINNGTVADTLTGVTATSASSSVYTGLVGPAASGTASSASAAVSDTESASGSSSPTSSGAESSSSAASPSQPIPVPANSAVTIGLNAAGPAIVLTDLTAKLWTAQSVANVVFTFASGASITATLPVQLTDGSGPAPTVDVQPTNAGS